MTLFYLFLNALILCISTHDSPSDSVPAVVIPVVILSAALLIGVFVWWRIRQRRMLFKNEDIFEIDRVSVVTTLVHQRGV